MSVRVEIAHIWFLIFENELDHFIVTKLAIVHVLAKFKSGVLFFSFKLNVS